MSEVSQLAKEKSSMSRCHRPRLPAHTFPVPGQQRGPLQDEPLREAQVYCSMLNKYFPALYHYSISSYAGLSE